MSRERKWRVRLRATRKGVWLDVACRSTEVEDTASIDLGELLAAASDDDEDGAAGSHLTAAVAEPGGVRPLFGFVPSDGQEPWWDEDEESDA